MSKTGVPELPSAVLFACGRNTIRSPMAAAIMRHYFGHRVYVASVGVSVGNVDPFAIEAMAEIGINISNHRPQTFEDLHDTNFDMVISLVPQAHHRAIEMTRTMAVEAEYWPTPDPTDTVGSREQVLDAYRAVRDFLMHQIQARFAQPPSPNP